MIAAWLMFVVGVFNILLGLVMGPSIRTSRAIFSLKSDSVLPTHTSNNKRSGGSSYPAPSKMDIEFPTPSNGSKSSLGFSGYDIDAYSIYAPPAIPTRPSEMVERSNTPVGIHRARSGKGVVTIKTDPESIPESRISGDSDSHHPPSYPQGRAM